MRQLPGPACRPVNWLAGGLGGPSEARRQAQECVGRRRRPRPPTLTPGGWHSRGVCVAAALSISVSVLSMLPGRVAVQRRIIRSCPSVRCEVGSVSVRRDGWVARSIGGWGMGHRSLGMTRSCQGDARPSSTIPSTTTTIRTPRRGEARRDGGIRGTNSPTTHASRCNQASLPQLETQRTTYCALPVLFAGVLCKTSHNQLGPPGPGPLNPSPRAEKVVGVLRSLFAAPTIDQDCAGPHSRCNCWYSVAGQPPALACLVVIW